MSSFVLRFLVCCHAFFALLLPAGANPRLLVDMSTGEVLFSEDGARPWHPASLTKLMTVFVVFEAIAAGRVNLDTEVQLSRNAVRQPPSNTGLPSGTAMSLRDALFVLVIKSANDVAVAVAETVSGSEGAFVAEMNATAAALGLSATNFVNPHGLHDPAQVTSARDLAVLTLWIRNKYPQYQELFRTHQVRIGGQRMESNNHLLTDFAGTTGMKTGYICASGLNIVATVERGSRRLIAVVLGGSSGRERDQMTGQLLLQGLSGELEGTGQTVVEMRNSTLAPENMRARVCGAESRAYVAARKEAFPAGLQGEVDYLTDEVDGPIHTVTVLSRFRDAGLPRPRPASAPEPAVVAVVPVVVDPDAPIDPDVVAPIPKPRPPLGLQSD